MGVIPPDTAADEPPEDPPGVCSRLKGLRVSPWGRLCVISVMPFSGTAVLPQTIKPASRKFSMSGSSSCAKSIVLKPRPICWFLPATRDPISLMRMGTPKKGPSGLAPLLCGSATASSNSSTTALRRGFCNATASANCDMTSGRVTSLSLMVSAKEVASMRPQVFQSNGWFAILGLRNF